MASIEREMRLVILLVGLIIIKISECAAFLVYKQARTDFKLPSRASCIGCLCAKHSMQKVCFQAVCSLYEVNGLLNEQLQLLPRVQFMSSAREEHI